MSTLSSNMSTKHGLTVHIGHSHEKQKSYICSICDKEVQSKRNLANHMAKIHEGKKPYRLVSVQGLKFQVALPGLGLQSEVIDLLKYNFDHCTDQK